MNKSKIIYGGFGIILFACGTVMAHALFAEDITNLYRVLYFGTGAACFWASYDASKNCLQDGGKE